MFLTEQNNHFMSKEFSDSPVPFFLWFKYFMLHFSKLVMCNYNATQEYD